MHLNLCSEELTNKNLYTLYSVLGSGKCLIILQIFPIHTHSRFYHILFLQRM